MTPLLPGDQLWNRYRVERVAHTRVEGAWLSALHPDGPVRPAKAGAAEGQKGQQGQQGQADEHRAQFLLLPLCASGSNPLADFLVFLESVEPARRSLLLNTVEFIGDSAHGGCAVISAPAATPLATLISKSGPLPAAQILPLITELSRALSLLLKAGTAAGTDTGSLALLFARLIDPAGLSIKAENARLTLRLELPDAARQDGSSGLPRWPEMPMAPELYRGEAATAAACVFGVARVAAFCSGYRDEKAPANEAAAYGALAEWAAGKRDPAREFSESPQAQSLPVEFSQLLVRCLSKRPERRITTLGKLEAALEKYADSAWADAGTPCEYCGFIMSGAGVCPCCGNAPFNRGISETLRGPVRNSALKPRKGETALMALAASPVGAKTQLELPAAVAVLAPPGMTLIPSGAFLSGERKTPRNLRSFAIDTMPVTEGEYKTFLAAQGKSPRAEGPGSRAAAFDNHPAAGVSWHEASEYAMFQGKRLPTVYEWEKAARGTDGRKFPFGNVFKSGCGRLRPSESQRKDEKAGAGKNKGTVPVGTHPDGASPYGVLDMAGNVLEWTSSARRAGTRLFRAVKGACYQDGSTELARCAGMQYLPADCNEPALGFRCVKDLE